MKLFYNKDSKDPTYYAQQGILQQTYMTWNIWLCIPVARHLMH